MVFYVSKRNEYQVDENQGVQKEMSSILADQ
jgi:hypothetical protein